MLVARSALRHKKSVYIVLLALFSLLFLISCDSMEKKVARTPPAFSVTATQLYDEYCSNKVRWIAMYKNKVLKVSGYVSNVGTDWLSDEPYVTLVSGSPFSAVYCSFSKSKADTLLNINKGDWVTIKGLCTGKSFNIEFKGCILISP